MKKSTRVITFPFENIGSFFFSFFKCLHVVSWSDAHWGQEAKDMSCLKHKRPTQISVRSALESRQSSGFLRWSEISVAPPRHSARNLSKHAGPRATGIRLRWKSACSTRQNTLCIQLYKQIRGLAVAASFAFYVLSWEKLEMTQRFVSSLFSVFQQGAGHWLTARSQRGFTFPARFHQFRPADLWF